MTTRRELLAEVMRLTHTSQSELSRLSGVHQPSISQVLSNKVDLSDERLNGLLSCMGYRLEVVRRFIEPDLTRSERRSWLIHRRLARSLTPSALQSWKPVVHGNLVRLGQRVRGEPHTRNLERWRQLVDQGDVRGLRRVLTGLDRDAIEMREVSPLGGLLSEEERATALARVA